jgi:hypothetical protein
MKIYQFKTENFRIVVDTEPEHYPDFSFDETEETRRKVESGEWECFVARATLYCNDMKIARDYLGQCIYSNPKDFRNEPYFSDMVRNVISEGRYFLESLPKLRK